METYAKQWRDLVEDDVIRIATGDGIQRYAVDISAKPAEENPRNAEVWLTEIDESENPISGSVMWTHVPLNTWATVER